MAGHVAHAPPLSQLDVLIVDCQATGPAPRGHLLELGWSRVGPTTAARPRTYIINLPRHERIPPAVARVTGISERMAQAGADPQIVWRELRDEAGRLAQQPAPTVIHFARFEDPFLRFLAGGALPLDLVCTHAIAQRLFPDLPRRSLRALAGYFGRAVAPLRRSADHVDATAFVWRELVRLLDASGISTWRALREWLGAPIGARKRARRTWPMPRDLRLSAPDAPGIYRMLRTSGDVLYIGKAASLHHRVNSYFRKQHGVPERLLEMLSQARGLSFETTPTVLEAALLEPDEIKRHRPPYNVALTSEGRELWFTPADLGERAVQLSARHRVGPFPSADTLDQFSALTRGDRAALGAGRWSPDQDVFDAGYARLRAAHGELSHAALPPHARLLRLGTRLWHEGRRDRDEDREATVMEPRAATWTPESVQQSLEWLALRAALATRRARWLTWLIDSAVVWTEPGAQVARLIVIENGEIAWRAFVAPGETPPVPPGHLRPTAARRTSFTVARFDRVRVLTTELKRLVSEGAPVALRFGAGPVLDSARLARALSWV